MVDILRTVYLHTPNGLSLYDITNIRLVCKATLKDKELKNIWVNWIDWFFIAKRHNLSAEFMNVNMVNLDRWTLSKYQKLENLVGVESLNRIAISERSDLSIDFISRRPEYIDWDYISAHNPFISPDVISKFADKINWVNFSTVIPEEYIEKYADKVDWHFVSQRIINNPEIIWKIADRLDWWLFSKYISPNIIDRFSPYVCEETISWLHKTKKSRDMMRFS